jgi:CheY-like chemotaxis protein
MHALVIEDDAVTAMLIEEELRDLGFSSVDSAATEEEAITAVARRCPDLVTCDGTLHTGNGVAAARSIRHRLPVPVIFITGDGEAVRASVPGAQVLEKPFSLAALAEAVAAASIGTRLVMA